MKRKRLIAAFLSLMLVVTVVMPAANALGTGTIELGPNEGTSATETPVEEPAEPETPVEEPTDPGASDEQTPTDPDDTDTSDEGTEQTPTDPDDTDTSDEETATDPDDTDTSDEETPDTPAEEPTEPETPVEEPTEPDTPAEEPTEPETPVEEPTEPETPTEEPTVPETPEQLPAEEIQEIPVEPLAAGDLTITLVDENGERLGTATISQQNYQDGWTSVSDVAGAINNPPQGYTFSRAYTLTYFGYREDDVNYIHYQSSGYGRGWRYSDSNNWWESGSSLDNLYFVYTPATGQGETGYFYIRLDGQIPQEPKPDDAKPYPSGDYTAGIEVSNAVAIDATYQADTNVDGKNIITSPDGRYEMLDNDITDILSAFPTLEQIQKVCKNNNLDFDPEEYYIIWYVQKYETAGAYALKEASGRIESMKVPGTADTYPTVWHIDGVIMRKEYVVINYDPNTPVDVDETPAVPQSYEVKKGTEIIVGQDSDGSTAHANPTLLGYEFTGWNTKADGTGTPYANEDTITMTENVTLYAQWVPEGNYKLVLRKQDALENPLSNVQFTLTPADGVRTTVTTNSNGSATQTISANTKYTIHEVAESLPAGYQPLESDFSFALETQGDQTIVAVLYDTSGGVVNSLENVAVDYNSGNKTITITVTNIGYFYVFHTAATGNGPWVEEIPIDEENVPGGKFNIVDRTEEGYLYGGYYKEYGGKNDYTTPTNPVGEGSEVPVGTAVSYTGAEDFWNGEQAYKDSGFTLEPVAGTTYYLKEVPNTYLHPATYVVYDTHDGNQIVNLYLLTATDDANYSSVGFDVTGSGIVDDYEQLGTDRLYEKVEVRRDGALYQTLEPTKVFKAIPAGLLALSTEKSDYIVEKANYVEAPYFITLDGVKVTGNQNLKVYLRNATFQSWKLPGITKIAQSKDIVNGVE